MSKKTLDFIKRFVLFVTALCLLTGCINQGSPFKQTNQSFRPTRRDFGVVKGGRVTRNTGTVKVEKNGLAVSMGARALKSFVYQDRVFNLTPIPKDAEILKGKTVFIDAGHGVGAPGGTKYEGIFEHTIVLQYAKMLEKKLSRLGATVVMTRETELDVDNYVRMAKINAYSLDRLAEHYEKMGEDKDTIDEVKYLSREMKKVVQDKDLAPEYFNTPYDERLATTIKPVLNKIFEYQKDRFFEDFVFVSVHHNGPHGYGTYTYAMSNESNPVYYREYDQSAIDMLAIRLQAAMVRGGGFVNRGIRYNDFFMLRETNIVSGLLEIAYLHNKYDRKKLLDQKIMESVTDELVLGIESYFYTRLM